MAVKGLNKLNNDKNSSGTPTPLAGLKNAGVVGSVAVVVAIATTTAAAAAAAS